MYSNVDLVVEVKKETLLAKLKENREKHSEAYEKAKIGFRKLLEQELEKKLQACKDGKKVNLYFKNQKPDNHLKEYDDVIDMLEFAEDETIEINHVNYKQWVQDQWDWAKNWATTNSTYISSASL